MNSLPLPNSQSNFQSRLTVDRQTFDRVIVPVFSPAAMLPVKGQGSTVWDDTGREYIDLGGGIAVTALGHCHPAMIAAAEAQMRQAWHLSNVVTNRPALELATRLIELTFADRVFFCNSGAEANEAAFKLARRHGNLRSGGTQNRIVACFNAFHGRTLFTVSVGGQAKYTESFEPLPGHISHVPLNDIQALEAAITPDVCAFVVEPVQGEGGVRPADVAFLRRARELCEAVGALLVFDEIQTGMGRAGSLFAYQEYGVKPDVLTSAKGLGGGFPIGAMLATEAAAQVLGFGTHGTTYGGNPLACAVSGAVLAEIVDRGVLAGVKPRAQRLARGLNAIGVKTGLFEPARGLGLLIGLPMAEGWKGRAGEVVAAGLEHGAWALVAGPDVVRFAPALNISERELDEGLARFGRACESLVAASVATAPA